jgi:hypothetical protein
MFRDRRFAPITLALTIAVVLVASGGPMAGFAHSGDETNVRLNLMLQPSGKQVIRVDPPHAKIWRDTPDKPKDIYWMIIQNAIYYELFWELRYDPTEGDGSADYFGDIDIECGKTEITDQLDKKPDSPFAHWPYSVTVYACVDGFKAQKLGSVGKLQIVWKD